MKVISLEAGATVQANGEKFVLLQWIDEHSILGRRKSNGRSEVLKLADLEPFSETTGDKDLLKISKEAWAVARKRFAAILPLVRKRRPDKASYLEQARAHGVHFVTIYRWRNAFIEDGTLNSLLPEKPGRERGKRTLDSLLERIIGEAIHDLYLTKQRASIQKVHEEIKVRCREQGIQPPHYNTVRNRISELETVRSHSVTERHLCR